MVVAFLCHFNALPLHSELEFPDRTRIRWMIHIVMGGCCMLYGIVGVMGYLYARSVWTFGDGHTPHVFSSAYH